jgi:hypothetical protein
MENQKLLSLMIEDHNNILGIIDELKSNIRVKKNIKKTIDDLEWRMLKHVFIEEKVIFTIYDSIRSTIPYIMIPKLIKEHNIMLNNLSIFTRNIKELKKSKINDFIDFLTMHKNFEEKELYPKFDRDLTENQKNYVIKRITEILL